ncbi:MAG: PqqD family protein [Deltaproteobacteria bacterium]|nr:PqqD family protein [Deltaproteobacteria bacterium]
MGAMQSDKGSVPANPRRLSRLTHSDVESTGESVVYDPETDKATVLNPVAAAIWLLCDGTRDCAAIRDEVAAHAGDGVDRGQIAKDVARALAEFLREGLIEP